jgi:hypothetical protein
VFAEFIGNVDIDLAVARAVQRVVEGAKVRREDDTPYYPP